MRSCSSVLSYQELALKELMEEIGVTGKLKFKDKFLYKNKSSNHSKFVGFFELRYEGEFRYEDGEVDFIQWFDKDEIKGMIKNKESFHPKLIYILEKYYFI